MHARFVLSCDQFHQVEINLRVRVHGGAEVEKGRFAYRMMFAWENGLL